MEPSSPVVSKAQRALDAIVDAMNSDTACEFCGQPLNSERALPLGDSAYACPVGLEQACAERLMARLASRRHAA